MREVLKICDYSVDTGYYEFWQLETVFYILFIHTSFHYFESKQNLQKSKFSKGLL